MNRRNGLGLAAPLLALLLCVSLAACEKVKNATCAQSADGCAGHGGNGGAGGASSSTVGSGGNGGAMTTPVCSPEQTTVAISSWPWFGFEQALPDPKPDLAIGALATVTAVEAGGLRVMFDQTVTAVRLAWAGPDLNAVFTAGDMVTVTTDAGIQAYRVTGAKGQAVVFRYANADVPTAIPSIPGGGPSLKMDVECVHEQLKSCPMPELRTLYQLSASLGNETAQLGSGKTATIGAWTIRHVKSMNVEFFTAMDCIPDKFFDGTVHALEVKP